MKTEKVFGKVMQTKDGVFEIYKIDYQSGKVGGYKLFPTFGEGNPYRVFDIKDVRIESLRRH